MALLLIDWDDDLLSAAIQFDERKLAPSDRVPWLHEGAGLPLKFQWSLRERVKVQAGDHIFDRDQVPIAIQTRRPDADRLPPLLSPYGSWPGRST